MIDSESLSSMTDRYCRQILTVNIKPQELLDTKQCLSHRNRCSELNVDFSVEDLEIINSQLSESDIEQDDHLKELYGNFSIKSKLWGEV